jgi:hypothetical protein
MTTTVLAKLFWRNCSGEGRDKTNMTHRSHIHPTAIARLTVAVLVGSPLLVLGSQPATQPAPETPSQPLVQTPPQTSPQLPGQNDTKPERPPTGEEAQGGGRGRQGRGGYQSPLGKEITDAAMPAAMQFMQKYSPKRYAALESLPDGPRKNGIKSVAAAAYLQIAKSEKDEPKLYAVLLKRTQLEDDVFGLVSEVHKTPSDKQDALKTELRGKVKELVNTGIEERHIRLDMLQQTLKIQQAKLAGDEANLDALVDRRYTTILTEDKGLGASFNAGGGGGNGGAGQRGHGHQAGEGTPP